MKIIRVSFIGVVAVVMLIGWLGLEKAESANLWPNKAGELSWITNTNAIIDLAVVKTYKNHYIVHGTITEADGYVRCINGNAEIVGGSVIMHGSTSGFWDPELIGSIGHVELDLTTLNGESEGLTIKYDKNAQTGVVEYDGVITWTFLQ
jgi:hypothetical protein